MHSFIHIYPGPSPSPKVASVVVLDMAAVIHIIKTQHGRVFGEYTQMDLIPYLHSLLTDKTTRVDAVWDKYGKSQIPDLC